MMRERFIYRDGWFFLDDVCRARRNQVRGYEIQFSDGVTQNLRDEEYRKMMERLAERDDEPLPVEDWSEDENGSIPSATEWFEQHPTDPPPWKKD